VTSPSSPSVHSGPMDQPVPWSVDDFLHWFALLIIGLALVVAGWWMASGRGRLNDQVGPASLAVAGVILASAGHVVWVLRGRRAVGERMARVASAQWLAGNPNLPVEPDPAVGASTDTLVVAADASTLFHLHGCPLVRDRAWPAVTRASAEAAGRSPCRVCHP
jgi:hypothetical protein